MVRDPKTGIADVDILQAKYSFVRPSEILKTLFKDESFRSAFFANDHACVNGRYSKFCCGEVYRNSPFFRNNQHVVWLNIGFDDFQAANALGSKAGTHKICAGYMSVRNLQNAFLSRTANLDLLFVCNSDDIHTRETDFNDLWKEVVKDVHILETEGINIELGTETINIRATVTFLSHDNLGGNIGLGLARGFNADIYCRICNCARSECQKMTREDILKIRTRETYNNDLKIVNNSDKIVYKETGGVERYCSLNDLNHFHIFENISADTMHDINEGAIPFILSELIEYCVSEKIFTLASFQRKVQSFDYGSKNASNIPSLVCLKKKNLGQNASQSICLFLHFPLILYEYRNNMKLQKVWICIESLIGIIQIVQSDTIYEKDIINLEKLIHVHLSSIQRCFNVPLIPKHHFMLHYPRIIRKMGPFTQMNMMRFEAKHKSLKNIIRNASNYTNLPIMIAKKHQEIMSQKTESFKNIIKYGKMKSLEEKLLEDIRPHLEDINAEHSILLTTWFQNNGYKYKHGQVILHDRKIYEIDCILVVNTVVYFFCCELHLTEVNKFVNAAMVEMGHPPSHTLIRFDEIKMKKNYDKKRVDEHYSVYFIVFDNLDMIHNMD